MSLPLSDLASLAQIAESVATVVALGVGATWAYLRFRREREGYSKVDLTVDIDFLGTQHGHWIVHLVAEVTNHGKVRHWIHEFQFCLRALPGGSPPAHGGAKLCEQVVFPDVLKRGTWLPPTWDGTFVDPGVTNTYRHVAAIPVGPTFVLLHGSFRYKDSESEFHNAAKAFCVPHERALAASSVQP